MDFLVDDGLDITFRIGLRVEVDNSVNRTNVSQNISREFYRKTVVFELFSRFFPQ